MFLSARRMKNTSRGVPAVRNWCHYGEVKATAPKLQADAERILADAKKGNAEILYRREGEMDVYFKSRVPGSTDGLLVKATSKGIVSIDQTSIESFEAGHSGTRNG